MLRLSSEPLNRTRPQEADEETQLHQRFPVYCRPLPFLLGAVAFIAGLHNALNWAWAWSLQTGNIFIQISVPTRLLVFEGIHLAYWILGGLGLLIMILLGSTGRTRAQLARKDRVSPLWRPSFRFYPLTLALGLFLTYFGIVFLFNASVSGDDTPSGLVAFVYLNYAGIVRRGIITIASLLLLLTGLSLASVVAFRPGLGLRTDRRAPTPADVAPAAPITPARVAPPTPVRQPPIVKASPTPRPRARTTTRTPARPSPASPRPRSAPRAPAALRSVATAPRRPRAPSASRSS